MNPRRRRMQIRQRQKRRRKNVSFRTLSFEEQRKVAEQEAEARKTDWLKKGDGRNLTFIEHLFGLRIFPIITMLANRFNGAQLQVLEESAGLSTFKTDLKHLVGKETVRVTTADVRGIDFFGITSHQVNVIDLVKHFGKNKFHLVVSSAGGLWYSPVTKKALFQVVSVLKPGGIGIVYLPNSPKKLFALAKRFRITINYLEGAKLIFTKNFNRNARR